MSHTQTSNDTIYRALWEGIQRFSLTDPGVLGTSSQTLAEKVRSQDFVLFGSELSMRSLLGDDCRVAIVDAGMRQALLSPVLPKGSALTKPLSDL